MSAVLTGEEDLDAAGERVWRRVVKVAGGAPTACEVLDEQQLSVSRFGPSSVQAVPSPSGKPGAVRFTWRESVTVEKSARLRRCLARTCTSLAAHHSAE